MSTSWPTALKALMKSDPMYTVTATCSECGEQDTYTDMCLSKVQAAKVLREAGWEFDKGGNWFCPECNNERMQKAWVKSWAVRRSPKK
jgi:hypothetical protein